MSELQQHGSGGGSSGQKVAIIIGAGSAGLLTAQALQMQGAKVTVYEQDAGIDARPRDWNFGIYWAQTPLQECLPEHLAKEVENAQVDDRRAGADELMPIYNGSTEELIKEVPIPYNIRLARKRFLRLITQGVTIEYGKRLTKVSTDGKSATAHFEDGSTTTGDLLVGADSAHSVVREFLVGPSKALLEPSPLVATATMAKLPTEAVARFKKFGPRLMTNFHPAGYFSWIGGLHIRVSKLTVLPSADERLVHDAHGDSQPGDWTFMMIMTWKPSDSNYDPAKMQGNSILQDVKVQAEQFGPNIRYMWQSIPDGTQCWHNRLSYWVPEPWNNHNGTVTLVGDAAHPMTFHRGQGLNNAIHDVATLAREWKDQGSVAAAVNAYEREMIPRARNAVLTSNENSLSLHDWSTLSKSQLFIQGIKQK